MTRTRAVRATVLTAAALASTLLAGTATAVAAPAASHHRATVVVHTTAKHKVVVPASTRPGVARIKNTGSQAIFLTTPRHGAGAGQLAHDLNADTARGLIKDFFVADALPAKATTYLRLARGTYFLADTSRDEFTAASVATLRVSGRKANATVPAARAVVVTKGNTVNSPASLARHAQLRLRNDSTRLQEVLFWGVAKKATTNQINALVAKPSAAGFSGVVSGEPDFLGILSPKARATSSQHSAPGRYLVIVYTVRTEEVVPHFAAGQVRLVTVK